MPGFSVGFRWVKISLWSKRHQLWKSSKWLFLHFFVFFFGLGFSACILIVPIKMHFPRSHTHCVSLTRQNHLFRTHFFKTTPPFFLLQPCLVLHPYLITLHALMMSLIEIAACLCYSSCNTVWSCPMGGLSPKQQHDTKTCSVGLTLPAEYLQ